MTKALQQGQADGMCGLYAVLNFLNRTEWKDTPSNGLWYLLEACRHFGWLTPQHLVEGFEDYHLKAILDLQFDNYRLGFRTHFLSDVASQYGNLSDREQITAITGKKGSIIIQTAQGGHWVLIAGDAHGPVIFDSADGHGKPTPLGKRRFSPTAGWGVVILPCDRSFVAAEL